MTRPVVSVVIPTHDRTWFLSHALATVLWQADVDLEVIVVDDGSIKGAVASVPRIDDARVRVLRSDDPHGVSSSRNRGIEAAEGSWVAFLDDDDVWAPAKLASQLAAAAASRSVWAYPGAVKIDAHNRIVGGQPPPAPSEVARRLPRWNPVPGGCSGVIVRRDALSSVGVFDPRLVNLADWDLWIRLGSVGPPARAADPLVGYRYHHGQASLDTRLILAEADVVERRYGSAVDRGSLHLYLAHRSLLAGRRGAALRHFASAAGRGEAVRVLGDLSGVAFGRAARRVPALRRLRRADPNAAWRERAAGWLRELDELVPSHPGAHAG